MLGFRPRDLLAIATIVAAALLLAAGEGSDPVAQARMASIDLRTLAQVFDWYREEHTGFPLHERGLQSVESALELQSFPYVARVVNRDPWGNPYRYWSDGRRFVLLSAGPDGVEDTGWVPPARAVERPAARASSDDIVLASDREGRLSR